MLLRALPQKSRKPLVCLKKKILHTCLSGNLTPQTFEKSCRLFFHPFQFAIRHLALQFIPYRESSFHVCLPQECYRLFFGQGAVCYENFD